MIKNLQTPYFVIREELLSQNVEAFRNALNLFWPNSILSYSVKTNALPWILKWMRAHDISAEVVSDEEYQLALLSSYSPTQIVLNGPIKGEICFREAISGGSVVNIDSAKELKYLERYGLLQTERIGIRVNVDPSIFQNEDVGYQEDGFRFGFSEENGELKKVISIIQKASTDGNFGLHIHVNSITRSVDVYRQIAKYAAKIIRKYQLELSYIDIGGGFFGGVPEKTTPEEYLSVIREELKNEIDPAITCLIIEPGSALIGSAVELHASILDVKDTVHARIVTTDASRIYIDPLWLKKNYLFSSNAKKPSIPRQVICGYTCMDHDRIMVIEDYPEFSIGDDISFQRVGNYTVTFGGPFIRPYPPVYVESNGELTLVRKAMTIKDYYRMETV